MGNGVKARTEYGNLILTCDAEAFARLRAFLRAEPSVAEAMSRHPETLDVKSIIVQAPRREGDAPRAFGWLMMLPTILASGISGAALIVGYITIARWFMHRIG